MRFLILFLAGSLMAGQQGLWRIWRSSFTSDTELRTMRNDIALLNSSRPQPPEYHWEKFNVSTNTNSTGIQEGNYSTALVIDSDTVEGLMSGHLDLEKLSSVITPLANGWVVKIETRAYNSNGWIIDSHFNNYSWLETDFDKRWKVKVSTP